MHCDIKGWWLSGLRGTAGLEGEDGLRAGRRQRQGAAVNDAANWCEESKLLGAQWRAQLGKREALVAALLLRDRARQFVSLPWLAMCGERLGRQVTQHVRRRHLLGDQ
jgi:hypothetical protein